jgi:uncharacterized protein YndB with AHSA1/START domain
MPGVLAQMEEGWTESLEKLADDFATGGQFTISRLFDAPRELVWDVWTKCEHLMKWWGPKGMSVAKCELDFRPGGTFHYGLRAPDGSIMWGKWTFREIVKPEKLVFVVSFSDAKGGEARHPWNANWPLRTHSVVTFEEQAGGKTRVSVEWTPAEGSSELERRTFDEGRESMNQGWGGTLDQFATYVKTG